MSFLEQIISLTIQMPLYQLVLVILFLLIGGIFLVSRRWRRTTDSKTVPAIPAHNTQVAHLISHEFSNPLQSILTALQHMPHESASDEAWQRNHMIALHETRRLNRLVNYVRLLTAGQTMRQPVNLMAVIEDALMNLGDLAEKENIVIHYEGPERLPRVLGNRDQLTRVVENLLENGIKYRREITDEANVIVRASADDKQVLVEVADNGRGIAPENLPHIFSPTFRSPEAVSSGRQGVGLGLALAKHIVEVQHDGQLDVRSQLGEYTVFSLSLPIHSPSDG